MNLFEFLLISGMYFALVAVWAIAYAYWLGWCDRYDASRPERGNDG